MKTIRGINLSVPLIVLVCFFLPWVQVSCAGAKDSLSGLDLARNGEGALWLIPLLLLVWLVVQIIRASNRIPLLNSIASIAAGLVSTFLMNRERARVSDESGLISAQLTGWFWLGFFAAVALAISGLILLLRGGREERQRVTQL